MYTKVLVAIDGSAITPAVLREAARLAVAGSQLRIISVVDNPLANFAAPYGIAYDHEALHHALQEQAQTIVTGAQATLKAQGIDASADVLAVSVEHGVDIPSTIEAEAEAWGADLMVIGTHGRRGLRRLLLGSVSEQLIRQSRLPVLLVRGQEA